MIKFKYPNSPVTDKQKELIRKMKRELLFDIDENKMNVQDASDFITEHLSRYINSVRVEYDEWDGYEFHHERGDV